MKKLVLLLLISANVCAFGQGTIDFKNDTTSLIRHPFGGGNITAAEGFHIALYWAPLSNPDHFTQLQNSLVVGGVPPVPGQFFGGTRTTGTETAPGTDARFMVRAWERAYGATFEEAAAHPGMGGRPALLLQSAVFVLTTGNPNGAPPIPAANLQGTLARPGFTGVSIVPEPSTLVLGLAGLGSLLMFRRLKKR